MEAIADQAPREGPGRVLAAERERQGLGPADVAQRLHMSVWQVEALEAGDYTRLPRGPFLKGFVRNYAKMVGLVPAEVVALLADGAPRETAPRIVVPSQNIHFEGNRITAPYIRAATIAGVALVFGFAGMYWWLFVRNAPPINTVRKPAAETVAVAPAPVAVAPAPVAVAPAPVAAPTPPRVMAVEPPKPQPEPVKAEPAKKMEPPKPEPPKAAPTMQRVSATESGSTLKFRFAGKSWVEIRDAGGKVLVSGLNDAGSEAQVSGKPPFRIVIGNAPQVRMYYNDREFDLGPHMREAVARVTVE